MEGCERVAVPRTRPQSWHRRNVMRQRVDPLARCAISARRLQALCARFRSEQADGAGKVCVTTGGFDWLVDNVVARGTAG